MRNLLTLLLLALLTACAQPGEPSPEPEYYSKLEDMRAYWLENLNKHQDIQGFLHTEHCDSLLWSGLASVGGADVNLLAAQGEPGQWYRRPLSYPECFQNGYSRSTISRDMLLGLLWATVPMLDNQALDILVPLYDYGKEHNWRMGDGRLAGADTLFPPAYIALLADLLYARGYTPGDVRAWTLYPNNVDADCKAYVCHVNVLRHYLRHKVSGASLDREGLAKIADRYPQNPLFQYVAGRTQRAIRTLIGAYNTHIGDINAPYYVPFCEEWPMQENGGPENWARCVDGKDTGGGFLFLSWLMLSER